MPGGHRGQQCKKKGLTLIHLPGRAFQEQRKEVRVKSLGE